MKIKSRNKEIKHSRKAFTLAEVLIALVVIGVIAAITVPVCIENYRRVSVPAKLKKFYSSMNNALRLWYASSGNYAGSYSFESSDIKNAQSLKNFYDNGIGKYLADMQEPETQSHYLTAVLNDGSGFYAYIGSTSVVYFFYCTEFKYCGGETYDGKTSFLFTLRLDKGTFITSSSGSADGKSREELLSLCKYGNYDNASVAYSKRRHACARLIQVDGWQMKDDYPWKGRSL